MSTLAQRSLAAGEISPALYARTDQVKYATGLRTCRNCMVQRSGGVASRPGTTFVGEVKDSTKTVRLIPFIFNSAQTYVLEFGHNYIRFHQNGAQVTETPKVITGATQANPAVITSVAHGFSITNEVFITGIVGMTQLNGRNFKISAVTANTFTITYMDGTAVNSIAFGAYASGGTAALVYTIETTYVSANLPNIRFIQSADVITLAHPEHPPRELKRLGNTNWTLEDIKFVPESLQPVSSIVAGTAGVGTTVYYKITAVSARGEESLPGALAAIAVTGVSYAGTQVTITAGSTAGLANGDEVFLASLGGAYEITEQVFIVSDLTGTTFKLKDFLGNYINSTGYHAWTSGGTIKQLNLNLTSGGAASTGAPNLITITGAVSDKSFNVYKFVNGVYGFIGTAYYSQGTSAVFKDIGATPDVTDDPPYYTKPFPIFNIWPVAVGMYQQRRIFGNTSTNPELVLGSRTGSFKNFTTSVPVKDDDSISFTSAGLQVNAIRHLITLGNLIIFTQSGEHSVGGDSNGALTPFSINLKQHSYCGASDLAPLVIDSTAIFVQARGNRVRDIAFDWQVSGYRGNDLSIFSEHLFENYTLVDWTFSQIPNSIVWAVRSDGKLLGFTYIREHQIAGWHRHDFDGTVENVCAVPDGGEDYLYLVIKRTINGKTVRYVERMASRIISNVIDFVGMDCALNYDGRNTDTAKTMTLTGGTNWDYTESLTLTSSSSQFFSTDVGNGVFLTGSDGTLIRSTITAYTSATVVTVKPNKTVPVVMRGVAISTWSKALKTIGSLWHIEGKSISVLGDKFVVSSPNNNSYASIAVSGGVAVLDKPYAVIHAGLPVTCDIETLDPDVAQGETMADKKKMVGKVTIFVEKSRGIWVGARPPAVGADPLDGLEELKIRGEEEENYDDPVALATGSVQVIIRPEWNNNGRVFIRQVDPIPLTVTGLMPAGYYPTRG